MGIFTGQDIMNVLGALVVLAIAYAGLKEVAKRSGSKGGGSGNSTSSSSSSSSTSASKKEV